MRRFVNYILFLLFVGITACFPVAEGEYGKSGTMNVHGLNLSERGVDLRGPWRYSPDGIRKGKFMKLPKKGELVRALKTPRFDLSIQGLSPERDYTLLVYAEPLALDIFINGKSVGVCGRKVEGRKRPGAMNRNCLIHFRGTAPLELGLGVYDYYPKDSLIWQAPILGEKSFMETILRRKLKADNLFLGVILIIGIYHLLLYFLRLQDKSPLLLALLCFLVLLRALLLNGEIAESYEDFMSWPVIMRFERFCVHMMLLAFVYYINDLFPDVIHRFWLRLLLFVTVLSVLVSNLPEHLYDRFRIVQAGWEVAALTFAIVVDWYLFLLVKRKRDKSALIILLGQLILTVAIFNDVAWFRRWYDTAPILHYSLAGFLLLQVVIIARNNIQAREKAEELSRNLEVIVAERTVDLKFALAELSDKLEQASQVPEPENESDRLLSFKEKHKHRRVVPFFDVNYFSSQKDTTVIHTDEEDFETLCLLKEMEQKLSPGQFMRVHKQFIVNISRVEQFKSASGGAWQIILKDQDESQIPVGRTFVADVKERLLEK